MLRRVIIPRVARINGLSFRNAFVVITIDPFYAFREERVIPFLMANVTEQRTKTENV